MSTSLADGQIFANRYKVVRCIGSGGMGSVYEVIHLETERRRALKVMHAHFADSPDFRERFKREARVAAQIDSEHIVDVFDAGVDEATKMPFLAMELLRGEELARILKRVGKLSPADAIACLSQATLALDKTHRASIVHRDLKPENIFLCERSDGPPQIKVLDFGIAKFAAVSNAAHVTNGVGTPLYMAPEQFKPGVEVTPAADIYALGLLAYFLLIGSDYWSEELEQNESVFAFAMVAMKGPIEPPSARARRFDGNLPASFDDWFARATAVAPQERFASASEAVRELASALRVAVPAGRPTFASLQGSELDSPLSSPLHNSRTTPAGSATTMSVVFTRKPRRGWVVPAVGAALVGLALATLAVSKMGIAPEKMSALPASELRASGAVGSGPTAPVDSIVEVNPIERPAAEAEPKAVEPSPARPPTAAKARPKAPKPASAPPKAIYSRD